MIKKIILVVSLITFGMPCAVGQEETKFEKLNRLYREKSEIHRFLFFTRHVDDISINHNLYEIRLGLNDPETYDSIVEDKILDLVKYLELKKDKEILKVLESK